MFDPATERQVADLADAVVQHFGARWPADEMSDIRHHLKFAQYDEVISNLFALMIKKDDIPNPKSKTHLDILTLVRLLGLDDEIAAVRAHLNDRDAGQTIKNLKLRA